MKSIVPQLDGPKIRYAESQPEYEPITAVAGFSDVGGHKVPSITYAFALTDEEAERIFLSGDAIYLTLVTNGGPPQPVMLMIGKEEAGSVLGLRTTEE
jgi:hypothetical protein